MYALYSPELSVLERVRGALPPDERGIATTSWSEFEAWVGRADCLLIATRWLSDEIRAPLRAVLLGASPTPLILITTKDADNARSALGTGAAHIIWLGEAPRKLHSLVCSMRARGTLSQAGTLLERSSRLPSLLRSALAHACRAERPLRSVGQLAAFFRCDRRTLWRHWHRAGRSGGSLRLEDFLDWVVILHAARLKPASRSWAQVAEALGTHGHTLARMATRLADTTLTNLGEGKRADLEARFLETVVRPLAVGDLPIRQSGTERDVLSLPPCSARHQHGAPRKLTLGSAIRRQ